jgi:hypothetical protein
VAAERLFEKDAQSIEKFAVSVEGVGFARPALVSM